MKRTLLWVIIILLIAAAIWGLIAASRTVTPASGDLAVGVSALDWQKGDPNAPLTLVEYSDFECPACASYFPIVKAMEEEFAGQLRVVYRHFPLKQLHNYAELAAIVSEAAGRQGKFWEMHDLLFTRQSEWAGNPAAESFFVGYIQSLGLDMNKFKADLTDQALATKVAESYKAGIRSSVKGTPTFFLNGKLINNPKSAEEFRTVLRQALGTSTVATSTVPVATTTAATTSRAN